MADWRKTQYRLGPRPDPLAEVEDFKYGCFMPLVMGGLIIATVACLIYSIIFFLGR